MPFIFIVEDDNFYANMVRMHLEGNGLRKTRIFTNGKEAIDQLHEKPEIIILDYDLVDSKGIQILKQIKSINPEIQVIFLSGQEDLEIAVSSLKYGAFDYLEKNELALDRLLTIIKRIEHHKELIKAQGKYKSIRKVLIGVAAATSLLFLVLKDQLFQ